MKSLSKILLVTAVAVTAFAISSAPSEARHMKKKAMAPCTPGFLCSAPGASAGVSNVMICGGDGKWYQALFTPYCMSGPATCPAACM